MATIKVNNGTETNSIWYLDLSGNNLTRIDQRLYQALPSINIIILDDNPWICDCQMSWIRKPPNGWSNLNGLNLATCAEPVELANTSIICYNASMCNDRSMSDWISEECSLPNYELNDQLSHQSSDSTQQYDTSAVSHMFTPPSEISCKDYD